MGFTFILYGMTIDNETDWRRDILRFGFARVVYDICNDGSRNADYGEPTRW